MIFVLSLIFTFGSLIVFPFIFVANNVSIGLAILYSVLVFIGMLALFCILILILLATVGNHLAKTYNPFSKKRWAFMVDISRFCCFWLGLRIKVEGLEKIDFSKTIVIYSNHQCFIDPLMYFKIFAKKQLAPMYKESLTKVTIAKGIAKAIGGVSVNRMDDRSAMVSIINIIKEVKSGLNFIVFPEGTRSKGIGLHHFKAGAFKIVQKSGADMVICALEGTYRKRLVIPLLYTPVHIKVVEVVSGDEIKDVPTHEIATKYENLVKEEINSIRKKYRLMKPRKYWENLYLKQKENEDVF